MVSAKNAKRDDMGRHLSAFERELYQRVDEVLHYEWDPIGVRGVPQARDEYDGYLPHVFGMLLERRDAGAIAEYLGHVEGERMGLTPALTKGRDVAETLLEWAEYLREKHSV